MDYWVFGFLASNLILSILLVGIIIIKKLCKDQVTVKTQYSISRLFLLTLLIPFLPAHLIKLPDFLKWIQALNLLNTGITSTATATGTSGDAAANLGWMQDFTISVNRSSSGILANVLLVAWIAGILVMLVLTVYGNRRLARIKTTIQPITDPDILSLFQESKLDAGYHREITLSQSPAVKTPLTFGMFRPYVILPCNLKLSLEDLKCVFLHEFYHRKNKDLIVNYLMCLCRTVYWFNPFVWFLLSEMQTEREIVCDVSVLKTLDEDHYVDYGNTILSFATSKSRHFQIASEISSTRKQVKKRIMKIANFESESRLLKAKSAILFTIVLGIIASSIPSLTAFASNDTAHTFSAGNVVYEDLGSYFEGYTGSFVLYDPENEQYTIYNEKESTTRVTPISTYKIYSLLFALESKIITEDNSAIPWDKTDYPYASWNMDQNLYSAMQNSVTWYFQNLDRRIDGHQLQKYVDRIGYGNRDLSGGPGEYWIDSSLKISPVEQVKLLSDMYNNELNFTPENITVVKDAIFLEESNGTRLSGKTGTCEKGGKYMDGWFTGYIEAGDKPLFFAVHIKDGDNASGSTAARIALSILDNKNLYQS